MEDVMAETKDNMVLRTVYLPLGLDRELRQLAFSRDVSKADLIRDFIRQGLGRVQASGERTLAEKVQERIDRRDSVIKAALASDKSKASEPVVRSHRKQAAKRAAVHT
jgi:hypothetical protein